MCWKNSQKFRSVAAPENGMNRDSSPPPPKLDDQLCSRKKRTTMRHFHIFAILPAKGNKRITFGHQNEIFAHNAVLGITRGGYGGARAKHTLHVFVSGDTARITFDVELPNSVKKIVVQRQCKRRYSVALKYKLDANGWFLAWRRWGE